MRLNEPREQSSLPLIDKLRQEHAEQIGERAWNIFINLSEDKQDALDKRFYDWILDKDPLFAITLGPDFPLSFKKYFYALELLDKAECNFEQWIALKGYSLQSLEQEEQTRYA